jgi:hypothetical protein
MEQHCHSVMRSFRFSSHCSLAAALLISLSELFCHNPPSSAPGSGTIVVIPMDTTIIQERSDCPVRSIHLAVSNARYSVILGYDDDFIAVRTADNGTIHSVINLPVSLCDSIYPLTKDSMFTPLHRLLQDGSQVYLASRRWLSEDEQAYRLKHRVQHVSFSSDSILNVVALIAGVISFKDSRGYRFGTSWTPALLRINLNTSEISGVKTLRMWHKDYIFTTAYCNDAGTRIVNGVVNRDWRATKKSFSQYTMNDYRVESGDMTFFAVRDSGCFRTTSEDPSAMWIDNSRFVYANGNDSCVYSNPEDAQYKLPRFDSGELSGGTTHRYIRGISLSHGILGVYTIALCDTTTRHRVLFYMVDGSKYLGAVDIANDKNDVLYCCLGTKDEVLVYRKADVVRRIRYGIPRGSAKY